MKSSLRWGIIVMLLAVILVMAAWQIWGYNPTAAQVISGDIDGNDLREKYMLGKNQLQVFEDSHLIWHTPKEWQVKQIKLADADNNGQKELLLVVWKEGSFGKSKPFWITGADDEYSCHLFLYRLAAGKMRAVWCSSALEHPIIRLDVKDSNADGLNELQVTEGPRYGFAYALRQYLSQQDTLWGWNDWGFERID